MQYFFGNLKNLKMNKYIKNTAQIFHGSGAIEKLV